MLKTSSLLLLCIVAATGRKGFGPGDQEWGYYDVRPGAHMFYWLYYTTASSERPLVIWIEGGPGASGAGFSNFNEIGLVDEDMNDRKLSWVHEVNVLFIDNPVGAGFSYVDDGDLACRDNNQIAADLVNFTRQFMKEYPKFSTLPLYIFSESYGGKMTAQYAYALQKDVEAGNVKANLKGIGLGNSLISSVDYLEHMAPFLLHMGLIDYEGHDKIAEVAQQAIDAINEDSWAAGVSLSSIFESYIAEETMDVNVYNVLAHTVAPGHDRIPPKHPDRYDLRNLMKLMNGPVKETLGIPANVSWGRQSGLAFISLFKDFYRPVTQYVEKLLNETEVEVIVYNGQLDLVIHTPGQLSWVHKLKWPGAKKWRSATRTPLTVDGLLEGYVKKYDKLSFYWINRSGHMVPIGNPAAGVELLRQVAKLV